MTTIAERLRALYATHPAIMEGADALDAAEKALVDGADACREMQAVRRQQESTIGVRAYELREAAINAVLSKLRGTK